MHMEQFKQTDWQLRVNPHRELLFLLQKTLISTRQSIDGGEKLPQRKWKSETKDVGGMGGGNETGNCSRRTKVSLFSLFALEI